MSGGWRINGAICEEDRWACTEVKARWQAYRLTEVENDHECSPDKCWTSYGQAPYLYQRGSGAKNLGCFAPYGQAISEQCAFCTDDKHIEKSARKGISAPVFARRSLGVPV